MNDEILTPEQELKIELEEAIKKRTRYGSWDFRLVHIFLWLSILASFVSAIIIASGVKDKLIPSMWVAVIAGIPGLVISIEKTFDFGRRSSWDIMYEIDLKELKDDLAFEKIDHYQASKKLREIVRKNEIAFANIGFYASYQSKPKDGTIEKNSEDTASEEKEKSN